MSGAGSEGTEGEAGVAAPAEAMRERCQKVARVSISAKKEPAISPRRLLRSACGRRGQGALAGFNFGDGQAGGGGFGDGPDHGVTLAGGW